MSKTYEGIYENGTVKWLGPRPAEGRHHIVVTVLDQVRQRHSPQDVRHMLEDTRGAWGTGKSISEIDAEIERMRREWDRPDTCDQC